jgi:Uri superfamily endonuclease
MNNLTGRLHRYDEIAKGAKFKIDHLMNQIKIATAVLEKNKLAKDGKLTEAAIKQLKGEEKSKKKTSKKKKKKK